MMWGIARILNARAIASPRQKTWTKPTIAKFIDNHHYAGLLKHDGVLRRGSWAPIGFFQPVGNGTDAEVLGHQSRRLRDSWAVFRRRFGLG
jgi:Recombinase